MNFELLYVLWDPEQVIFHLGSIGVRWYSLCWLLGLLLGYLLMQRLFRQQAIADEKFEPMFIYVFFSIIIGARLGHCLFYEPSYYLSSWDHLVEMIVPMHHMADGSWKYTGYEGLASHGGVIGVIIGIVLYVRHTKVPLWVVLDNMGIVSCVTACFIRLGNLMNSEIIGKVTDVPWAFIFERVDPYPRHPGQLYEAIAYAAFFAVIWAIYRRQPRRVGTGYYFGLCLTLIFIARFAIEYTKEIQVAFEAGLPFDMGQILSIPFILLGLAAMKGGRWVETIAKAVEKK